MSEIYGTGWHNADLQLDDVRLRYVRAGTGPAILLLHGLTDDASHWWRVAQALIASHQVVILEQRGHGESSAPDTGYALSDFVRDAVHLIDALHLAPVIVVGHSLGGLIGLYLTADHPQLVSKLVIEDPPLVDNWASASPSQTDLDSAREAWFSWAIALRAAAPEERLRYIRERSPGWTEEEYPAWVESKLRMSPRLWGSGGIDLRGDWRSAMRRLRCPTLLVRGGTDRGSLVDVDLEGEALALNPLLGAVHIPGASHSIHKDETAHFLAALSAFLDAPQDTAR